MTIRVPAGAERVGVVGSADRNLKLLREALGVKIAARDGRVVVSGAGPAVGAARRVLDTLLDASQRSEPLNRQQVIDLIAEESSQAQRPRRGWEAQPGAGVVSRQADGPLDAMALESEDQQEDEAWEERLNVYVASKPVRPRTPNQLAYLRAIRAHDLVFGLGPAGTGKTYLAVAAAVHLLRAGRVKRVVLTRPAVEAGEKLGYLPGDLREKVNPYLRPLFDALNDMMDFATARRFMEHDVIEVVPLAFMRGRTLNHSVIILDEAQNCTRGQMKMFLTRMGQGSKMIVTGDPSQNDLPEGVESGLLDAARLLARTQGVGFVGFEKADVVRHDLVKRIVDAYEQDEAREQTARPGAQRSRETRPGEAIAAHSSARDGAGKGRDGQSDPARGRSETMRGEFAAGAADAQDRSESRRE